MLPHFWLLTILSPLALGVPVPQVSVTPNVTFSDGTPGTLVSDGRNHMGLNRANTLNWNLKAERAKAGSKTTSDDQGSPSLDGYSGNGTSVSFSGGSVLGKEEDSSTFGQVPGTNLSSSLSAGTSDGTGGGALGGTMGGTSGGTSGGSSGGTSNGTSGGVSSEGGTSEGLKESGLLGGHGGVEGGKIQEQVQSHGGGSATASASNTGSDVTTNSSEGITIGTTTDSEGTADSDGITTSTSKHK
ncbi:MAG: hypothetical protein Q9161_006170 [Pseudevernia consocians]